MDPNMHVKMAVMGALQAAEGQSDDVKKAAVSAAVNSIPPPDGKTAGVLWIIFIGALCFVVVASAVLAGVYMLVDSKAPPDSVITIFSSTLAALVGLFAKSPSAN